MVNVQVIVKYQAPGCITKIENPPTPHLFPAVHIVPWTPSTEYCNSLTLSFGASVEQVWKWNVITIFYTTYSGIEGWWIRSKTNPCVRKLGFLEVASIFIIFFLKLTAPPVVMISASPLKLRQGLCMPPNKETYPNKTFLPTEHMLESEGSPSEPEQHRKPLYISLSWQNVYSAFWQKGIGGGYITHGEGRGEYLLRFIANPHEHATLEQKIRCGSRFIHRCASGKMTLRALTGEIKTVSTVGVTHFDRMS